MRSFVLFSILGLAGASASTCLASAKEGGLSAGNDFLDASVFTYAALQRCQMVVKGGGLTEAMKCEIDVSEALHSVVSLTKNIILILDDCKLLNDQNIECGQQAAGLVQATAGLSGSIGKTLEHCPRPQLAGTKPDDISTDAFPEEVIAKCSVYVKDSAKSIFDAITAISQVKKCEPGSKQCVRNGFFVADALAGLGSYLAGTFGYCDRAVQKATGRSTPLLDSRAALCAEAVESIVKYSSQIANAGLGLSDACGSKTGVPRLYDVQEDTATIAYSSPNMLLAALLPVTAIVAFVGGRAYGKRRPAHAVEGLELE